MHSLKQCVQRLCSRRGLHTSSTLCKIIQYKLSDIGEGIREVTVKGWFVQLEDTVSQFDNICEVESDKAAVTITSRYDGKIKKLYHKVGEIALVGNPLVDIDIEDEEGEVKHNAQEQRETGEVNSDLDPVQEHEQENWNKSLATPAVRRIAMENKVKLSDVKGSGKHGRVMKEDILEYLNKNETKATSKQLDTKPVPLSSIQRVMVRTMTASQAIPTFLYCEEVSVRNLVLLRKEIKGAAEKQGISFTYLPFFIKTISKCLLQHPILNSSLDEQLENIAYKNSHNIGLAVDSPAGLLVPNIKNVQSLSLVQIAKEITRIQSAAAAGKLGPFDLSGGTFSISNIGSIGGTYASPMILPPEVCILAVGKIHTLPRFDSNGNVFPDDIINISISADHRIIDGATVARFAALFKYYVENPSLLVLDL